MDTLALEQRTIHLADCGPIICWSVDDETATQSAILVDNRFEAAWSGPAVFGCSIVLPDVAVIESLVMSAEASATLSSTINGQTIDSAGGCAIDARLMADQLPASQCHGLPGLPFTDFVAYHLAWRVAAEPNEQAHLQLDLTVDFQLPIESAAAYLTYIMTQA